MNLMCFGSARLGMGLEASVDFVRVVLWFRTKRYLLISYKMLLGFEVAGVALGAGVGFGGEEMRFWDGRLGVVTATCAVSAIGFWLLIPSATSSWSTRKFKAAI